MGSKPVESPSLSDSQPEFQAIAREVWGSGNGRHPFGTGVVYAERTLSEVLKDLSLAPDFEYRKTQNETEILFVHRKLAQGEIYWVNNRNKRTENIDATFRVQGLIPEIWHPDTGNIEPSSYKIEDGRTTVSLHLDPIDALFVVFRKPAKQQSASIPVPVETPIVSLDGSWDVSFQSDRGAPAKIALNPLSSWTENSDVGVKYFSGTGTYTKTIQADSDWFSSGAHFWLDLGSVQKYRRSRSEWEGPWVFYGKLPFELM